jgi:hypothetical protein
MKDKAQSDKTEQEMKNRECDIVIQYDRQDLEKEKQKQNERTKVLLQVTTRNKEVKKIYIFQRTNIMLYFLFF